MVRIGRNMGLDLAFVLGYNYSYVRDKALVNDVVINNFSEFMQLVHAKTPLGFRDERREEFLMMLRAETVSQTVKYAEDLAAISMAFAKGHFQINITLRIYSTSEIRKFFSELPSYDYGRMRNILGYPDADSHDEEKNQSFLKSADKAKSWYADVGKFHSRYSDLYNCFKHGLRVMPVETLSDKRAELVIMKFPSARSGQYGFQTLDKEEYDRALRTIGMIATIMDLIFQNHKSWYFGHAPSYQCLVL